MRGTKPVCTPCAPCEQHPCCEKGEFNVFKLVLTHVGCCDCSGLNVYAMWNFTGVETTYDTDIPCFSPPSTVNPPNYPDCLRAALEAHGGFGQVEIYIGLAAVAWPEYQQIGIPDIIDRHLAAFPLINRDCFGDVPILLCRDITFTGTCVKCPLETGPTPCDFKIIDAQIGFIVRAADGYEALRCVQCLDEGEDIPLPACSSSSGDDSGSVVTDDSSGESDDSSDGDGGGGGGDDGSSVSSSDDSSGAGSSGSGADNCSCYVRVTTTRDEITGESTAEADVVFEPPGCGDTRGNFVYSLPGFANVVAPPGTVVAYELEPCTSETLTVVWNGIDGRTCSGNAIIDAPCGSSSADTVKGSGTGSA
jgi:hypothetical protein